MFYAVAAVIMGLIICAHIISVVAENIVSKILYYVNICLHMLLVAALLLAEAKIELLALSFMLSLFSYLATFSVKGFIVKRRKSRLTVETGADTEQHGSCDGIAMSDAEKSDTASPFKSSDKEVRE